MEDFVRKKEKRIGLILKNENERKTKVGSGVFFLRINLSFSQKMY